MGETTCIPGLLGALPEPVPAPRRLDADTARLTWSTEGGSLVLHADGLCHPDFWLELNLTREWVEARLVELAARPPERAGGGP
jgi:hypothetical protein